MIRFRPTNNLLIIVLVLLSLRGVAQPLLQPVYKVYDREHGLASPEVYQVKQDSRGFLWLCTDLGISRLASKGFINYDAQNGLCSNEYFGIEEAPDGNVWFYALDGKLTYFDHAAQRFVCPPWNEALHNATKGTVISQLLFAGDSLFVVGRDQYYWSLRWAEDAPRINCHYTAQCNILFRLDEANRFLFSRFTGGATGGVDPVDVAVIRDDSLRVLGTIANQCENSRTLSACMVPQGKIYAFWKDFQLSVDPTKGELFQSHFEIRNTQSVCFISGDLWVGSHNDGAFCFPDGDLTGPPLHYFADFPISSICADHEGGLWFSTLGKGILYVSNPFMLSIADEQHSIEHVVSGDGFIQFISESGRLSQLNTNDLTSGKPVELKHLQLPSVPTSVFFDGEQTWVQTNKLYRFAIEPTTLATVPGSEHGLLEKLKLSALPNGDVMLLKRIVSTTKLTIAYEWSFPDSSSSFRCAAPGMRDKIFRHFTPTKMLGGSWFGLTLYNSETGQHQTYGSKLQVQAIETINADSAIIGTKNSGLFLFANDSLQLIVDRPAVRNLSCNAIKYEQNGTLWLASNAGIYRILNPFDSSAVAIDRIGRSHGLPSEVCSDLELDENYIYVGTDKGMAALSREHLFPQWPAPEVTVSGLWADESRLMPSESTVLPWNTAEVVLKFSCNTLRTATAPKYRYRWHVNSENWIETLDHDVRLFEPSPGDYRFEIQAADAHGNWGPVSSYSFEIASAIWQHLWFWMLLIVAIVALINLIVWNRIMQASKMEQLNRELLRSQNHAFAAQIKPHFVFNSVNSVTHSILNEDKRNVVLFLGKFSKLMRRVFDNAGENFIPLSEELGALKQYVAVEQIRFREKLSFAVSVDSELESEACFVPPFLLQPFVENAIWHGIMPKEKGGNITVCARRVGEMLQIEIEDHGVGIARNPLNSAQRKRKSGIEVSAERVRLLQKVTGKPATLDIQPRADQSGTIVTLMLPIIAKKPFE